MPDRISPAVLPVLWPLQLAGLGLVRDGRRLLADIDLTLDAGSLTAVIGANGAGKSLLLRLLHGMIEPTAGRITWGGEPMRDAIRLRQAMVFQRPILLRRSVAANIDWALGLRAMNRSERRDRRDGWLERVGLIDKSRQPARLLSGGEQQRLALARALALTPEVLFLDEPTGSLDPAATAHVEAIVADARALGTRMILVTHDLGQARRLADDIVFLHAGRLQEHTRVAQFFNGPRSPAARAYVEGRLFI